MRRDQAEAETDAEGMARVVSLLEHRRWAVLTGAGVSTDSGIPDYRSENAPKRTPITVDEFLHDPRMRRRYWAGSHRGWRLFSRVTPNDGHRALAQLERAGLLTGVVTQNVDGLHSRAGSYRVVPLHGSMDVVRCLNCGQEFARAAIAAQIDRDNPWIVQPDAVKPAPDGDAEVDPDDRFIIPTCTVCGGALKPDVVFFGEFVPVERFARAAGVIDAAGALVVAGSSLAVNSGVRLFERARRAGKPTVIINRGRTWGDSRADIKLELGTSQTLSRLARRLVGAGGTGDRAKDGKGQR